MGVTPLSWQPGCGEQGARASTGQSMPGFAGSYEGLEFMLTGSRERALCRKAIPNLEHPSAGGMEGQEEAGGRGRLRAPRREVMVA